MLSQCAMSSVVVRPVFNREYLSIISFQVTYASSSIGSKRRLLGWNGGGMLLSGGGLAACGVGGGFGSVVGGKGGIGIEPW